MKPYMVETGRMWRQEAQMIKNHLEKMVMRNSLPKLTVIADEIGMSHDEFHSKVSMSPRTPMTWSERIAIEHEMERRDEDVYLHYIREYHLNDHIQTGKE